MKTISLFLLCLFCTLSHAQKLKIEPAFRPNTTVQSMSKASTAAFKAAVNDLERKANFPPLFKFQFGLLAECSLNESSRMQSGLLINYKGWGK